VPCRNGGGCRRLDDPAAGEQHRLPRQLGVQVGGEIRTAERQSHDGGMCGNRLRCRETAAALDQCNDHRMGTAIGQMLEGNLDLADRLGFWQQRNRRLRRHAAQRQQVL
jgi:hypothetical protein